MYSDLINCEVVVIVSTRAETVFEYKGYLDSETDSTLKLRDAEINIAMLNFQKNFFGGEMGAYKRNIDEVVINKDYIISCNRK